MTSAWPAVGKIVARVGRLFWKVQYVRSMRMWRVKELEDSGIGTCAHIIEVKDYPTKKAALAWVELRRSVCASVA